jgi:histidyl-tRNA synthetase
MKAQMKAADRSGARYAVLVGPDELAAGEVALRALRGHGVGSSDERAAQRNLPRAELIEELRKHL